MQKLEWRGINDISYLWPLTKFEFLSIKFIINDLTVAVIGNFNSFSNLLTI